MENWKLAHSAAGARYLDPHRGFTDLVFAGVHIRPNEGVRPVPDPNSVRAIRANCQRIRFLLEQRLLIPAPTPPQVARTAWFTQWETTASPPQSTDPWEAFFSRAGDIPAVHPPAPL